MLNPLSILSEYLTDIISSNPLILILIFIILFLILSFITHKLLKKLKLEQEPSFSLLLSFLLTPLLLYDFLTESTHIYTILHYSIPLIISFIPIWTIINEIELFSKTKNIILSLLLSLFLYPLALKISSTLFENKLSLFLIFILISLFIISLKLEHYFGHKKGATGYIFRILFVLSYTLIFYLLSFLAFKNTPYINKISVIFAISGLILALSIIYLPKLYYKQKFSLNELLYQQRTIEEKLKELEEQKQIALKEKDKSKIDFINRIEPRLKEELDKINTKIKIKLNEAKNLKTS